MDDHSFKRAPRPSTISLGDLEAFGRGAALLGAGGGGDPYVGRLVLEHELSRGGQIEIVELASIADDAWVVPVCVMGAPTVMIEKAPSVDAFVLALRKLEERLGKRADYLIPLEIGGINSTVPLALSARLGLPVVNADGMGRAFPEIQMVTFGIGGNNISPIVVADEFGDVIEVTARSNLVGERLSRSAVAQMGGSAQVVLYPMSGLQAKRTAIPDTLRLALDIGRAITINSDEAPEDRLFAALGKLDRPRRGCVLFKGKVSDVQRETRGGFNFGTVRIERLRHSEDTLEIVFQNENLVAYHNGVPVALTPDIIAIVDSETAEPITTETLKFGQRVKVLGITAPDLLVTPEAIKVVGPRAFGIDLDYAPLRIGGSPSIATGG
ncbi:MAG TPA: DUF917 domain-containing protein [Steroidobacter sp.]|uniref:DUF917 domain-containing protein n=1 Tax=Steroidobacter sp. TaxID=1978227 RepID=UPI002EDA051C